MSDAKVSSETPLSKRRVSPVMIAFPDPRVRVLLKATAKEQHKTMSGYVRQAIIKSLRDDHKITRQGDFLALLRSQTTTVQDPAA
jgi:hypothetical protein